MNDDEYELKWITPEMFSQGWHELRNGIVYHHDFLRSDIVKKDNDGNYLVRIKKCLAAADRERSEP